MKSITLSQITAPAPEAILVPQLLDASGVEWQPVACCNWPESFPYSPKAEFRIAYNAEGFLVNYRATEDSVKATFANDNEAVWTDSCMEFFLSPNPDDGVYYNLECNCIGTVLLGARGGSVAKAHAEAEVMQTIRRWSSLGHATFEERIGEASWEVALVVPFAAYWHHEIDVTKPCAMRANFYKCGDDLQKPHFLSWNPINFDKPNFHLPQYFGELIIKNDYLCTQED